MSKHVLEIDEKCKACKGTGLYVGLGESDGAAVVCNICKGTGCHYLRIEYEDFTSRVRVKNIERVYQINPGIVIGKGNKFSLSEFGGMKFSDWEKGKPFPVKSENRKYTCPCWWYQNVDYDKKPDWEECFSSLGSSFSNCRYFKEKDKCWERWDKENS